MDNTATKLERAEDSSNGERPVDVEAIMAEIRRSVKSDLEGSAKRIPHYRPAKDEVGLHQGEGDALVYSDELNYLNKNWANWSSRTEITSHRKFLGPVVVKLKNAIIRVVWNSLFRDYFERERQFQANLVRFLNATARYIDKRDSDIFWQLVKKVDHEIVALNERLDRYSDELNGTVRSAELSLNERLNTLEGDRNLLVELANRTHAEITDLDELIRSLERTVALLARPAIQEAETGIAKPGSIPVRQFRGGVDYLLLENRYRGSENLIRERQREYVDLFSAAEKPVLEIGSGRGEFLELLREGGIGARGVDIDQAMVAVCKEKDLDITEAEAIAYLRGLPDQSLGGIFAAQVVEHLTREQLEELLSLAAKKVTTGGKIVLETINPQSVSALARNFFRDPTHVWPLHPDTLRFMMEMSGIQTTTIQLKAPYPAQAILQPIEMTPYLPARWRSAVSQMNDNISRLNELLFGFQDFAIIGVV